MKILTLNTHSLVEKNYSEKLIAFVSAIASEKPEIIALQEVNQTISAACVNGEISGYTPCGDDVVIKEDNHAFRVIQLLGKVGIEYSWTWLPLKKGYGKYEEGICVLSKSPIIETNIISVSKTDNYENWKTRKLIGIRTENLPDEWFYSVHYGWWNDDEEPFLNQWQKTEALIKKCETVWLMGDFNAPDYVRNESYDLVKNSYWHDALFLAQNRSGSITVAGKIDGWKERNCSTDGMRLDYIFCSKNVVVTDYETIFDGKKFPVVSDHYGVMINYERSIV